MARTAQRIDIFAGDREIWIEKAKTTANHLLEVRESITIEDVLERCPLPRHLHRNTIGRVLNSRDFQSVGYEPARHTKARGRIIQRWTKRTQGDEHVQTAI